MSSLNLRLNKSYLRLNKSYLRLNKSYLRLNESYLRLNLFFRIDSWSNVSNDRQVEWGFDNEVTWDLLLSTIKSSDGFYWFTDLEKKNNDDC